MARRDWSWLTGTPEGRAQAYSVAIILILVVGVIYFALNRNVAWMALSVLATALMAVVLYYDYKQRFRR